MPKSRRGGSFWTVVLGLAAAAGVLASTGRPVVGGDRAVQSRSSSIPTAIDNAAFWRLAADLSEPGGYFRIEDNFTSNEPEVGRLVTLLRERGASGGAYLGVGPEQNFSYIAAIRPAIAFIVDIRRQAALQHLMFKAIFEMATDRAEFISLLFAKPRPGGLAADAPIQGIWNAYAGVATDSAMAEKTYRRIIAHLSGTRGFALADDEALRLRSVFDAFVAYGPSISTRGLASPGRGGVTFADLTGWAVDARGQPQGFLATDDQFRFVKTLHDRNLIIPVTGDFGGPKALRAIGAYLAARGGMVSAFYVSNVEQYLFQDRKAQAFYENVAQLPTNGQSVFIRAYALRRNGNEASALCGIAGFLVALEAGRIYSHNDALSCPR